MAKEIVDDDLGILAALDGVFDTVNEDVVHCPALGGADVTPYRTGEEIGVLPLLVRAR